MQRDDILDALERLAGAYGAVYANDNTFVVLEFLLSLALEFLDTFEIVRREGFSDINLIDFLYLSCVQGAHEHAEDVDGEIILQLVLLNNILKLPHNPLPILRIVQQH